MFRGELLVSLALRERLGRLDKTAAAVGIFLGIHDTPSAYPGRPCGATGTSSLGSRNSGGRHDANQGTYRKVNPKRRSTALKYGCWDGREKRRGEHIFLPLL